MPPTFKPDIQRILLENNTKTFKEYIYGTITLYGSKIPNRIQFTQKSLKVKSTHHISHNSQSGIQFVLYRFRSPLLTISHIAFFSSTY